MPLPKCKDYQTINHKTGRCVGTKTQYEKNQSYQDCKSKQTILTVVAWFVYILIFAVPLFTIISNIAIIVLNNKKNRPLTRKYVITHFLISSIIQLIILGIFGLGVHIYGPKIPKQYRHLLLVGIYIAITTIIGLNFYIFIRALKNKGKIVSNSIINTTASLNILTIPLLTYTLLGVLFTLGTVGISRC